MKISDLLGEGWESGKPDGNPDARPGTSPVAKTGAEPEWGDVADPPATGPGDARDHEVITSLASWAPTSEPPTPERAAPGPGDPGTPAEPVSARAQLADLAAGLAIPAAPPVVEEPTTDAPVDEFAGLNMIVDDLLPNATKRRGSSRGSSRSGSRRRGR